jgi:hypothetical protein
MSHVPSLSPASRKAVTMDEVCLFKDGTNEFTLPPGKQPNRQFRIHVQKYLSPPSCAVSEFPLQMFSTWFQDLGLSKLMCHNKEKIAMKFGSTRLFCCTPQMFRQIRPRWQGLNWQQKLHSTLFNSTEADLRSIHHAVGWDPTIMVIERPIVKGEDHSENCGNQVNSQQRDGPPCDDNHGAGTARRTRRKRQNY